MPLTPSVPVPPGEPRAPDQVLAMLKQSEPTSSTLQLVASDMTGIMEKLDTRELDLEDGEYDAADANAAGASPSGCHGAHLPLLHVLLFLTRLCFCFRSRAFALQGGLPNGGLQGARRQSLPGLAHHRQDPGGGALHLGTGPLQPDHAEERQQGARRLSLCRRRLKKLAPTFCRSYKCLAFRLQNRPRLQMVTEETLLEANPT